MHIYHYDNQGFYSHQSVLDDSDRDPLTPTEFLIPANASPNQPPPPAQYQIARWIDGGWALVPHYVGVTYYLEGESKVMTTPGVDLPVGACLEKPESVLSLELAQAKQSAVNGIEQIANQYHARIVGTADRNREARFALNLEAAKKVLLGTATDIEQQMLFLQLEANQQAGHPVLVGKTLEQFAQWIVDFEKITMLGAGMIESTLIKGRTLVNAASSMDEIGQIKATLAQEAERIYQDLVKNYGQ